VRRLCFLVILSEKVLKVLLSVVDLHGPVYLQDQSRPSSRAEKKIKENEEANKKQEQNALAQNEEEERQKRTGIQEKEEQRKKEEK
jgi:hypothetical protein